VRRLWEEEITVWQCTKDRSVDIIITKWPRATGKERAEALETSDDALFVYLARHPKTVLDEGGDNNTRKTHMHDMFGM
jgi:hypothetical protein